MLAMTTHDFKEQNMGNLFRRYASFAHPKSKMFFSQLISTLFEQTFTLCFRIFTDHETIFLWPFERSVRQQAVLVPTYRLSFT